MSSPDGAPTADLVFEAGGVTITMSILVDEIPKVLAWSTSEVILYLGQHGPVIQDGLRKVFGS